MSWTGSERNRREQLPCFPPKDKPVGLNRFDIKAGTRLQVCRVGDAKKQWRWHTTKLPLSFDRYESRELTGEFVFRHEGWFLRLRMTKAKDSGDANAPLE